MQGICVGAQGCCVGVQGSYDIFSKYIARYVYFFVYFISAKAIFLLILKSTHNLKVHIFYVFKSRFLFECRVFAFEPRVAALERRVPALSR